MIDGTKLSFKSVGMFLFVIFQMKQGKLGFRMVVRLSGQGNVYTAIQAGTIINTPTTWKLEIEKYINLSCHV